MKFSTNGLLLKPNLYHFPNSGNHLHICLDKLFRDVSGHGNLMKQCHQVMPLETDKQLDMKTSFSDTQVIMQLFFRSKVPIFRARFHCRPILHLLSWLSYGVLHHFLKQCFLCYLCVISTKHLLANGGSNPASSTLLLWRISRLSTGVQTQISKLILCKSIFIFFIRFCATDFKLLIWQINSCWIIIWC